MYGKTNKIKSPIVTFVTLLLVGVVTLYGFTIPVFADDSSRTRITDLNPSFVTGELTITVPAKSDFTVPLCIKFNSSNIEIGNYISGTFWFSTSAVTYYAINGNQSVQAHSFINQRYDLYTNYKSNTNSSYTVVFLDNFMYQGSSNIVIGDLVFHNPNNTETTFTITPVASVTPTVTDSYVYRTSGEYGYVNAMIYALEHSSSISSMLTLLNNIGASNGYLNEILTEIHNNHQALYTLIQNVWATDQAILGVDQNIYHDVHSILVILENQYASQQTQAESIKEDVEQQLDNLANDINVVKPSAVADIADTYINQIDTQYNASVFSFITTDIFILMLCIVFAFAVLSYLLYGGK